MLQVDEHLVSKHIVSIIKHTQSTNMNADIKQITIESLQDFLGAIKEIEEESKFEKVWFRGIPDESYGLEPSLYRKTDKPVIEKQLLNRFKTRSLPFIDDKGEKTDWEWLFIMQHYGVPTRLLDWSESALLGLAFAVIYREDKHKDKDAAVWCLDPIKLNRDYLKGLKADEPIPSITDKSVKKVQVFQDEEIPVDFPISIYGPLNNVRIVAQKGVFTLFPFKEKFKLEDLEVSNNFLVKIIIPLGKLETIKKQLLTMGITENNVYPGLDSIAKEINREILNA